MTVKRFEAGEPVRPAQANAMRRSFEEAGIAFLSDGSVWEGKEVAVGVVMVGGKDAVG